MDRPNLSDRLLLVRFFDGLSLAILVVDDDLTFPVPAGIGDRNNFPFTYISDRKRHILLYAARNWLL